LEAFACKLPVIASRIQAHVEIGGDAPVYVNPKDYKDFAKVIKLVMEDEKLRKEMIEKGIEKVEEYSWDKVANETADIYRKIA
jgi:glycosyltransferase involved in cell wall biosynthesis